MNKNNLLPIVVAIAVFASIYFFINRSSPSDVSDTQMIGSEETNPSTNVQNQQEPQENATESTEATYVTYSEEALAQAHANGKRPVLFFHASWCPTCKALNDELNEKISTLPSDVVILKTDYDTYTELKQKYGVTIQHTLVQVDTQGNEVSKWVGGNVDTIIQKVL